MSRNMSDPPAHPATAKETLFKKMIEDEDHGDKAITILDDIVEAAVGETPEVKNFLRSLSQGLKAAQAIQQGSGPSRIRRRLLKAEEEETA